MMAWGVALALATAAQNGPIDWSALPPLPYRAPPQLTESMHGFAAREARTGRCSMPRPGQKEQSVRVDLAVLIDAAGTVRAVVPRAINCPTVEQYAAGLVSSFARSNLLPRGATDERWYRTAVTFSWQQ
ncbi:hypothetical protein [Sphingosinithalassobacter sp. LHW66-3]|uniref:hypothetical protein n=1 Tax=Sphingosinithalassobacter sp. LHW66-3 TaxID=3424718 RepID=UPI003D6B5DDB